MVAPRVGQAASTMCASVVAVTFAILTLTHKKLSGSLWQIEKENSTRGMSIIVALHRPPPATHSGGMQIFCFTPGISLLCQFFVFAFIYLFFLTLFALLDGRGWLLCPQG